ncbi:MAG: DUF1579 family protein [Planctomycetota bacterium]
MKRQGVLTVIAIGALLFAGSALSEDEDAGKQLEMMKRWQEALKLTPQHDELKKLIGDWSVTREMKMGGMGAAVEGTATFEWIVPNRWVGSRLKIAMMGMMTEGFMIHGYDKVKKHWVTAGVSSHHPGLITTEGPIVDPNGKVQVQYGALDEFLTDEHDKPLKYVTKWVDDDTFTFELWDLGIGEKGRAVLVDTYTRVKK